MTKELNAKPLAPVHIRRAAWRRGPARTRDTYGPSDSDPQRNTLCGAPAGLDMSWAETRHRSGRACVTCSACLALREAALPPQ